MLRAALELFAEQGYDATSGAEIGIRAGYSRAMVHARFGTKADLVDRLLRDYYEERILPADVPGDNGLEMLLATVDGLTALANDDPALLKAVFMLSFEAAAATSELRPRIVDWLRRLEERVLDALLSGQKDGTIVADLDAQTAARDIIQSGVGAAYTWLVIPSGASFESELDGLRDRVLTQYAAQHDPAG